MFRNKLAELDRYIASAERRITQQRVLIGRLAASGRGTEAAAKLLAELQGLLDILAERRRKLLDPRGRKAA